MIDKSYLFNDHLGSLDVVTNAGGKITHSASFDAWGARRSGEDWASAFSASSLVLPGYSQPLTQGGFTGHEMLDDHGLIHMNGRIYDAKLARFLQADPLVDGATNTQGYNRYSYVHNNPLNAIDPSGFSSWTKFRDNVVKPVIQAVVSIYCNLCGAMLAAATVGHYGGSRNQMAIAAFSSFVMSRVGAKVGGAGGAEFGFNMATLGYATLGGAMSAAQGGKFGHGFVSAGTGSIAGAQLGPIFNSNGFSFTGLIASAVIGGTVSEISGGKFANGAQSAAFAYAVQWGAGRIGAGGKHDVEVGPNGDPKDATKSFDVKNMGWDLKSENGVLTGEITFTCANDVAACHDVVNDWRSMNDKNLQIDYKWVASRNDADLLIRFESRSRNIYDNRGGHFEEGRPGWFGYGKKLVGSEVMIMRGFTGSEWQGVVRHEWGHMMGAPHQYNSTKSIMSYYSGKNAASTFTSAEMNAIRGAY